MPHALPQGWTQKDNALTRSIQRGDFVEALGLVVEIGRLAEAANHHPDIALRGYRNVHLSITTHSAGNTVTDKDFALAQQINDLPEDAILQSRDNLNRRFQA